MNTKLLVMVLLGFSCLGPMSCSTSPRKENSTTGTDVESGISADSTPEQIAAQAEEQRRIAEDEQRRAFGEAIYAILSADQMIGKTFETVRIPEEMRKLSLAQCPQDFAEAYVAHVQAWEDYARVKQALNELLSDENVNKTIRDEILYKIFGSDHSPIAAGAELEAKLNQRKEEANDYVHTTFQVVERVAIRYGVTIPK